MDFTIHFNIEVPQLDVLGDKIVASLADLGNKMTELEESVVTLVEEIKQALLSGEEVAAVIARMDNLKNTIVNIFPDAPPVP